MNAVPPPHTWLRRARAEVTYLGWRYLRRFCMPCDVITWRWRHRGCCSRSRAAFADIARALGVRVVDWPAEHRAARRRRGIDDGAGS